MKGRWPAERTFADPLHQPMRTFFGHMARVSPTRWPPYWVGAGQTPAFAVMELRRLEGGVPGPARCGLLCAVDGALEPLQPSPAPAPAEFTPALATDDDGLLLRLLKDAMRGRSADFERWVGAQQLFLYKPASEAFDAAVREQLAHATVRPLAMTPPHSPWAVFPLSDPALSFSAVHRAIRGVVGFAPHTFLALVREFAEVHELEVSLEIPEGRALALARLSNVGQGERAVLAVFPGGQARLLQFRHGLELSQIRGAPQNPTLRCLDLALLDSLVFRATLGIHAPEQIRHPQISASEDFEELVRGVLDGEFQAGFALRPPPVWEIRAVMEAAVQLPPHTLELFPTEASAREVHLPWFLVQEPRER